MDAGLNNAQVRQCRLQSNSPRTLSGAVALWALLVVGVAGATDSVTHVVIRGPSLAPQNGTDAEQLYVRIGRAARDACGDRSGLRFMQRLKLRECVRDAVESAVATVDNSYLTAVHVRAVGGANERVKVAMAEPSSSYR